MHGLIKDHVETYLKGASGAALLPPEFTAHLKQCEQCRFALAEMHEQSDLLRQLRPAREHEPAPGFYARVMDRVESRRRGSIWSAFLDPALGKRLVLASLASVLVLGSFLALTETETAYAPSREPEAIMAVDDHPPGLGEDRQRDRDTILVDLATYRE